MNMKTVLIAEDNDSNYILMTYILKRSYQFLRAKNGKEAVDAVENGGIDLVLMDVKMPIMDGLEATATIKEKHPELPVIALTANAFESDRNLAMEAGCNDFLSKPVSSEACLKAIGALIGV
jgi:CheY-like chemotaxis protein